MAYGQDSLTEISRKRDQQQGGYRTPFGVMGPRQGAPAQSTPAAPPAQSASPAPMRSRMGAPSPSPSPQQRPFDASPGNTPFPGGLAALQQRRAQEAAPMRGGMSDPSPGNTPLPGGFAGLQRMRDMEKMRSMGGEGGMGRMGRGGEGGMGRYGNRYGGMSRESPELPPQASDRAKEVVGMSQMGQQPSRYRTPFGTMGPGQGAPLSFGGEGYRPLPPMPTGYDPYAGDEGSRRTVDDPRARDQFLSMFRGGGGGYGGGGGLPPAYRNYALNT